jgi:hypothetical protein
MVGAVVLAGATSDDALAAKLLDAVRRQLAPASGSRRHAASLQSVAVKWASLARAESKSI